MADEDGMAPLQRSVEAAQAALLDKARAKPDWWDADDLRAAAQNGWAGEVMMFALTDLVNHEQLEINAQLQVKAAPQPPSA